MQLFIKDILERTLVTFVQAFLGVWVVTDVSTVKTAAVAGVAAALAVLKGLIASRVGDSASASLTV